MVHFGPWVRFLQQTIYFITICYIILSGDPMISVCNSLTLTHSLLLTHSHSLCLGLSLCISVSLYLSALLTDTHSLISPSLLLTHKITLSLPVSLSLSLTLSHSTLPMLPYHPHHFCSLSHSLPLFLRVSPSCPKRLLRALGCRVSLIARAITKPGRRKSSIEQRK